MGEGRCVRVEDKINTVVEATIEGLRLVRGLAKDEGGAVYASCDGLVLSDCVLADSVSNSEYGGGGLYAEYADIAVTDCRFERNRARHGGGIQLTM